MSDAGLLVALIVAGVALAKYLWNLVLFVYTDDIYEYDYIEEARFLFTDLALLIASVVGVLAALASPLPVNEVVTEVGNATTTTAGARTIATYTSASNTAIVYAPVIAMAAPLVMPAAMIIGLDVLIFLLQVLVYYLRRTIGW